MTDRWILEAEHNGSWYSANWAIDPEGAKGTMTLEEGVRQLHWNKSTWIFRDRALRIKNIDTGEVVHESIL